MKHKTFKCSFKANQRLFEHFFNHFFSKGKVKMTTELKFEPVDCSLFCVGRNFSRVNIHDCGSKSTCFCSNDVPVDNSSQCGREATTDKNTFKSYKLNPFAPPNIKVKKFLSPLPPKIFIVYNLQKNDPAMRKKIQFGDF